MDVALAAPVVWATGAPAGDAGVGGADRRMNAANRSMSLWKLADGLAVSSDTIGVPSFGVDLN